MAMYPFKPGELMTGPVHYGKKYEKLWRIGRFDGKGYVNLYHVVMSYPHPVVAKGNEQMSGNKEKGFIAVWPFSKNGMENNNMAFLGLQDGNIKMLFGENAYAAWIEERDQMIGHYASINVQTIF